MKTYNKFNYVHNFRKYEIGDFVDRTSYISDEDQYERLMMAGISREEFLSEKNAYNSDDAIKALENDSIRDYISSTLYQNPHYSKQELHDILNSKYEKISRFDKERKELQSHFAEFLKQHEQNKYYSKARENVINDLIDKGVLDKKFNVLLNDKTDS